MNFKGVILCILCVGIMRGSGQTPRPVLQIDLQAHGWQANRDLVNGSVLPYTMDFADDGSLWLAFPSEPSKPLQSRNAPSESAGKVLHIAVDGKVLEECNTGAQRWGLLRLFARRTDGYTLEMADKLVTYDAHCQQRAVYPTDTRSAFVPSPDRTRLYTRTRDNHVLVLNADSLSLEKTLNLPDTAGRDQVLFGDQLIVFPTTVPRKGCWQTEFSRMAIATGQVTPWVTLECARFNLLGDEHVIHTNAKGNGSLDITGETGAPTLKYTPPHNTYLDPATLDGTPIASPQSLRVVEELIEAKGRHPSLDMSGKFLGREIVLLDMHTGTALLTVKIPLGTHNYAYALSRDGQGLAVLLNSQLSVYRVP